MAIAATTQKRAERGTARQEYYTPNKLETFGLGKRTRRLNRGDQNVTLPDGRLEKDYRKNS